MSSITIVVFKAQLFALDVKEKQTFAISQFRVEKV